MVRVMRVTQVARVARVARVVRVVRVARVWVARLAQQWWPELLAGRAPLSQHCDGELAMSFVSSRKLCSSERFNWRSSAHTSAADSA